MLQANITQCLSQVLEIKRTKIQLVVDPAQASSIHNKPLYHSNYRPVHNKS